MIRGRKPATTSWYQGLLIDLLSITVEVLRDLGCIQSMYLAFKVPRHSGPQIEGFRDIIAGHGTKALFEDIEGLY